MTAGQRVRPQRVVIYPVVTKIDGCDVYILEATAYSWLDGKTHYIVTCKVKCGDKESQVFDLDVTSESELIAKLKTEIAKFKLINMIFAA